MDYNGNRFQSTENDQIFLRALKPRANAARDTGGADGRQGAWLEARRRETVESAELLL